MMKIKIAKTMKMIRKKFCKYSLELVKEDEIEYQSKVATREEAYNKILEVFKLDKKAEEHFVMFALNSKNNIIAAFTISKGSIDFANVNTVDIVKRIILCNCRKIIVAHNHPSGNTTPSKCDIDFTMRLKEICNIIGIDLLDHLIIGDKCYQSIIYN